MFFIRSHALSLKDGMVQIRTFPGITISSKCHEFSPAYHKCLIADKKIAFRIIRQTSIALVIYYNDHKCWNRVLNNLHHLKVGILTIVAIFGVRGHFLFNPFLTCTYTFGHKITLILIKVWVSVQNGKFNLEHKTTRNKQCTIYLWYEKN